MDYAIEIKNLTKQFTGFTLENLNLSVPGGSIMGLIGENGAGKSTTLKCILGLLRPDSGSITVLGGVPRTRRCAPRSAWCWTSAPFTTA